MSWIIQQLQLSPIGMVSIHTPSTTAHNAHACQQYVVGCRAAGMTRRIAVVSGP
jgi:hypothetical protein